MQAVHGNVHQGLINCIGQGFQCTIIAVVALLALQNVHFPSPSLWGPSLIDRLVIDGSFLYDELITTSFNGVPRYLGHNEVPEYIHVWQHSFHVQIQTDMFDGVVGQMGNTESLTVTLEDALNSALMVSQNVLFTAGGTTISIFEFDNCLFVFDSHARNHQGLPCDEGQAVLLLFEDQNQLLHYLKVAYLNKQYNLSPVYINVNTHRQEIFDITGKRVCRNLRELENGLMTAENPLDIDFVETVSDINQNETTSCANMQEPGERLNMHLDKSYYFMPHETMLNAVKSLNPVLIPENFPSSCHENEAQYDQFSEGTGTSCSNHGHTEAKSNYCNWTDFSVIDCCEETKDTSKTISGINQSQWNHTYANSVPVLNKHLNFLSNHSYVNISSVGKQCSNQASVHSSHFNFMQIDDNNRVNDSELKELNQVSDCIVCDNDSTVEALSRMKYFDSYQTMIEQIPSLFCSSCCRVMFDNQVTCSRVRSEILKIDENSMLCSTCKKYLSIGKRPALAYHNNSLDAGPIPDALKGLNILEKRLISQVNIYFSLVLLPGFPVGQLGQKGFVIHIPVDINYVANQILSADVMSKRYVVASCLCHNRKTTCNIVRPKKVLAALKWLKLNNNLYSDICLPHMTDSSGSVESEDTDNIDFIELGSAPSDYAAPGLMEINMQGKEPVEFEKLQHSEVLSFPWLFPFGRNGFHELSRTRRLTLNQYFKMRLFSVDPRWRKDISYLINAVNVYEKSVLSQLISVYFRVKKNATPDSQPLQAKNVTDISNPDLQENSYMFMRSIRGTAAYWKNSLLNLLAMLKNLGPPTLFLTLSCNDNHWPELAMTLQNCEKESVDISSLPKNVQQDPLLTAIHFERRWQALLKHVINCPDKPLGKVNDYFSRVEFQQRGSAHMHIFLWIENAPNLASAASASQLTSYIDSVICTQIPDKEKYPDLHRLVTTLQIHSHKPYCRRSNKCRFNFPYKTCEATKLITNSDTVVTNKRFYETKRGNKDLMVNAYNPTILLNWRANMDIQMIGGPLGVAYYVCSYVCKAEPQILKNALSNVLQEISDNAESVSLRTKMFRIGMCVLKHRTLSAQEAAYRIGGLQLIWSSRQTINLHAFPPHKQYRKLKPKEELQSLHPNDENIFEKNIIDHYQNRSAELESYCLFRFCQCFRIERKKPIGPLSRNARFPCLSTGYTACMRQKKAVVRLTVPAKNTKDYYYSLLLLYLPHRKFTDIIAPFNDYAEAFLEKQDFLDKEAVLSANAIPTIDDALRVVRLAQLELDPPFECNYTSSVGLENTCEVILDGTFDIHSHSEDRLIPDYCDGVTQNEDCETVDICSASSYDVEWHNIVSGLSTDQSLEHRISSLTSDQLKVFDYIRSKACRKGDAYQVFISGGAGVGKSYLIEVLVEFFKLCCSSYAGNEPVIVCAPTGIAAHNVKGYTIHSLLKIPVLHQNEFQARYMEMPASQLLKLRQRFRSVQTLVIDEISMVSTEMLDFIHRRLTAIKQNNLPFGGLNIIAVGDFHQLRPVKSLFAFENHELWHLFKPFFLKQNMRQLKDLCYAQLLNRARIGCLTSDDIYTLRQRLVHPDSVQDPQILHIFPTLEQVRGHNIKMQSRLSSQQYCFTATHRFSDHDIQPEETFTVDLIPEDDRDAGGLPLHIWLSVGTKVMLLRNINVQYGLVNGAIGTVSGIDRSVEPPSVSVKFFDVNVPMTLLNPDGSVDIPYYNQEFLVSGRFILRTNLPVTPCWGLSIHKVQSLSLEAAVVHIGSSIFTHGQAYVALSRVKTLANLYLAAL